ncbi:MAG TPA: hypothetical protein VGB76_05895 [Pyrinomonadaceae bacterium]
MTTAAKLVASAETVNDNKTLTGAQGTKSLKATASGYSPQEEAQRRKWGVERGAVRSIHARKF